MDYDAKEWLALQMQPLWHSADAGRLGIVMKLDLKELRKQAQGLIESGYGRIGNYDSFLLKALLDRLEEAEAAINNDIPIAHFAYAIRAYRAKYAKQPPEICEACGFPPDDGQLHRIV